MPTPERCSFEPTDWTLLSRRWFAVARVSDARTGPVAVTLLDVALVTWVTPAGVHVARDLCPHRGVPLSMGWVEGEEIVCAYHGLRYGPDGYCRRIPSQPSVPPPPSFRATMLPALERYGLIWTCLDPSDSSATIPPFDAWSDPAFQRIIPTPLDIEAAPGRQVEGFVDVAHFAWVHHESFADRADQAVPRYKTRITDYGLQAEYASGVSNYPKAAQHLAPADFEWVRVFDIYPPFTATLTVRFPDDGRLQIMNAATPVSARRTRLFVPIARNFGHDDPEEDVHIFNAQIFAEDQRIVEAQQPRDLPLDPALENHFAADKTSVGYRRLLREMGLKLTAV